MDVVRKVVAATIFLLIFAIQLNPSLVNSVVMPDRGGDSVNSESDLISLQDEERWLIVPIHFPTTPFPDSEITSLVEERTEQSSTSARQVAVEAHWKSPYRIGPISLLNT